jgi:hypothetical protein
VFRDQIQLSSANEDSSLSINEVVAAQPFWLSWRGEGGSLRRHTPDLFTRLATIPPGFTRTATIQKVP